MKHWWKEWPWRLIQTNLREIDMADMDADRFVRDLQQFSATVAMINVGGILASYPTQVEDHTQSKYLTGDSLGRIIDKCHEKGIRVIARMDFSKARRPVYEKHPDWAYRTADGEIVDYNGDVHMCPCGGFQQKKAFEIMKEVAEMLPIDGVFMNMGGFQQRDYSYRYYGICHCENCKKKFREQFGLELPDQEDAKDPVYRKYQIFQQQVMEDYKERMYRMVKEINPEIAVEGVDFMRIESNTEYRRPGPQWQFSSSSIARGVGFSGYEQVCSNAAVDFIGFYYRHVAVSPYMQRLRLWQDVANFAGLDYYLIGRLDNHKDRSGFEAVKEVFSYAREHEAEYRNMKVCGEALLVRRGGYAISPEACGWIQALTESHILFEEAEPEAVIMADLSRYKVVILADVPTVSDELAACFDKYAESGGCFVTTGLSGRIDEMGEERTVLPFRCLGMESLLNMREDMESGMLLISEKERFSSIPETEVLFFGNQYIFARYQKDTVCHLQLIPPHPYGPPERCYYKQVTKLPGYTTCLFGKGKGIYVPWYPGKLYYQEGYGNTYGFLKELFNQEMELRTAEEKNVPPMVEITFGINEEETKAMIHLINGSGHFGRCFFEPIPIRDVGIQIPLKKKPKSVVRLKDHSGICYAWENGILHVELEEVDEIECLLIQLEDCSANKE